MTSEEAKENLQKNPKQKDFTNSLKLDWGGDVAYLRSLQESFIFEHFFIDCTDKIQLKIAYIRLTDAFLIVEENKLKGFIDNHFKMRFLIAC